MSPPEPVITTGNGTYQYEFTLYADAKSIIDPKYINSLKSPDAPQSIYTSVAPTYSEPELINIVGNTYYCGQVNLIDGKSYYFADIGIFTIDLNPINLGTFSAPYSYAGEGNVFIGNKGMHNSIVTNGTGNFAFAQGDLIVTIGNKDDKDALPILYYKKIA